MATNTCIDLVIHPDYKPYHLSATHYSNISFDIALRNIANKRSSFHEKSISDSNHSSLRATFDPQPSHEHSTEPSSSIHIIPQPQIITIYVSPPPTNKSMVLPRDINERGLAYHGQVTKKLKVSTKMEV